MVWEIALQLKTHARKSTTTKTNKWMRYRIEKKNQTSRFSWDSIICIVLIHFKAMDLGYYYFFEIIHFFSLFYNIIEKNYMKLFMLTKKLSQRQEQKNSIKTMKIYRYNISHIYSTLLYCLVPKRNYFYKKLQKCLNWFVFNK